MDLFAAAVAALWSRLHEVQTLPGANLAALDRDWARLWPGRTPEEQRVLEQLGEAIQGLNDYLARREGR